MLMFLNNFSYLEPSTSSPRPQSKGSIPQDPLHIEPSSLRGRGGASLRDRMPAHSFYGDATTQTGEAAMTRSFLPTLTLSTAPTPSIPPPWHRIAPLLAATSTPRARAMTEGRGG